MIATPGSGARLGDRVAGLLGTRAAGLHAQAVMHVPNAVAEAGVAAARAAKADGLVAAGGGSAIGLAKIIARDLGLPILALPTTYSGSEATPIWGTSEGERKSTGKDAKVLPRTIVYDPELTLALPPQVSAASGMNALAHCVEGLWVADRTPVPRALATEATRRFGAHLPRAVADGGDLEARGECLVAAWLAGAVLSGGTGAAPQARARARRLGLPHAETHAIILPHVARFNLAAAPEAHARLAEALGADDPADELAAMVRGFSDPASPARRRLRSRQDRIRRERNGEARDQRPAHGLGCRRARISRRRILGSSLAPHAPVIPSASGNPVFPVSPGAPKPGSPLSRGRPEESGD